MKAGGWGGDHKAESWLQSTDICYFPHCNFKREGRGGRRDMSSVVGSAVLEEGPSDLPTTLPHQSVWKNKWGWGVGSVSMTHSFD